MPSNLLRFAGAVNWVAGPGPGGITLLARIVEPDGATTPAQVSLLGTQLQHLPQGILDLTFETVDSRQLLLRSGTREWRSACITWQVHRDVGTAFYAAVPPRRAPLGRRLTWRVLLGVAATAPGQWLLSHRARPKP